MYTGNLGSIVFDSVMEGLAWLMPVVLLPAAVVIRDEFGLPSLCFVTRPLGSCYQWLSPPFLTRHFREHINNVDIPRLLDMSSFMKS